jgi:hypothetical protein
MSYKVIRNSQNAVVAFGPNNDNYAPSIPEGATLYVEAETPPPSASQLKSAFINAVQSHIDETAQSKGYDSGVSIASYAADTHPPFAAEAAAFIPWRSTVWLYCYTEWAKYEAGQRTFTTPESFVAELPAITWP